MDDVYIGKGKLAGKGVYALRDFKKGELVKEWNLKLLSQADFDRLPKSERMFVHSFWNKIYLFPEPSRYTNHSAHPNAQSDLEKMCDFAIRDIKKGEMITINSRIEVCNELRTLIEVTETGRVENFKQISGGYRNATVNYLLNGEPKVLKLKRVDGSWRILHGK
jgi:hypothetical protein